MSTDDLTPLFEAAQAGDSDASARLYAAVYQDLKSQARRVLRDGRRQTLCTTELVNETWLRLSGHALSLQGRAHFFNLCARAMRQVLVDRARARHAAKRGEGVVPITLGAADDVAGDSPFDVLALDQVMDALAEADARLAELAQLYLFAGLSSAEIAELRGVSERTVYRDWRTARMFLLRLLTPA